MFFATSSIFSESFLLCAFTWVKSTISGSTGFGFYTTGAGFFLGGPLRNPAVMPPKPASFFLGTGAAGFGYTF